RERGSRLVASSPHVVDHSLTGKPMKAVAMNTAAAILDGNRVGRCLGGHGLVEDSVEARIVPRLWEFSHHVADESNRRGIGQGGEGHRLFQIPQYLLSNSLMPVERRSRVNHPVADCI